MPPPSPPPRIHPSNHAAQRPDHPAYIIAESGRSVPFRELDQRSNQLARTLRTLGLRPGDGVALLMGNEVGFFEICWAGQRSGLHYTPISTHLKAQEIAYIVRDCGARAFIASAAYAREAAQLAQTLPPETARLALGGEIPGFRRLEPLTEGESPLPLPDEVQGQSMLYSSGTTGQPKGIRNALTGEAIDVYSPRLARLRERYGFDETTVYLSPAPLYHAAPLGFTMAVTTLGGTCVVLQRFDAERALAAIEQHRVTHSQWVPTMFVRMLRLPEEARRRYTLSSHRVAIHAAAPCPVPVKEQMIGWWGPILHEYYAGSEGIGSTHIDSEEWLARKGSVGRAASGILHIVGEDGQELPAGEVGTIYFEGAPRFVYHNAPEKTAAAFNDRGWATLGDIGYLDPEGYLYLTDRQAHMIISGGVNIYPQESEDTLLSHPAVLDAAVIGVPNEDFGEEVKAVVQLVPGSAPSPDLEHALIAFCRERLSAIKCPRTVDFADSLPRLPNGKLYKRELRDRYWPRG